MNEPTIQDQLILEQEMIDFGVNRFMTGVKNAEESGRGSETTYALKLTTSLIKPLAEAIDKYRNERTTGQGSKYRLLIKGIEAEKLAYFTLKSVFNHFMRDETIQSLASKIGWYVEDELKFSVFQEEHKAYYDSIIQDFRRKNSVNYSYMHKVLTYKANEYKVEWTSWTKEERVKVGTAMLNILATETDLIERTTLTLGKRKKKVVIRPTEEAIEWISKHNDTRSLLKPDRSPCIVKPDEWTSYDQGGYFSPRLRARSPLVKTRSPQQVKMLKSFDMSKVYTAVNALQDVPWKVNQKVLLTLQAVWESDLEIGLPAMSPITIPPAPLEDGQNPKDLTGLALQAFTSWKREAAVLYTLEKERVSKCLQVSRVVTMANKYKEYNKFWYVYQCDFRGRIYTTTSGFSPQGPDFSKALLQFSKGKKLGHHGEYWFKVHGANTYGEDKLSYDDRVKWIDEHSEDIKQSALDPLRMKEYWGGADKPWQFLAFCFEYLGYTKEGTEFVSHLPIALDGSCNGLQNFSAMLKDSVGGKATNLVNQELPSDIYAEVAKVLTDKVNSLDEPEAKQWIKFTNGLTDGKFCRKLAKRPVMTLPYGSTKISCKDYVFKYLLETAPNYFPQEDRYNLVMWLSSHLWDSISEVVVAARAGMDWLQECTSSISKTNNPLIWCTPVGFPVYQGAKKFKTRQIDTQLAGRVQFMIGTEEDVIDVRKQKQGVSPNFVHSMDACHLMLALNAGQDAGLDTFACIHDDFGVHACDTGLWHKIIRESFVDLYKNTNVLQEFKDTHEELYDIELPELPDSGDLDINEVKEADYFFG